MEDLKKSTEKEILPVTLKSCPVCGRPTLYAYNVTEEQEFNKGVGTWYKCSCGVIFQGEFPVGGVYNEKYKADYLAAKEYADRSIHTHRTYIDLLEELTYGRKWLDVGYSYEEPMNWLKERGWITWGIELNPSALEDTYHIKGDFEKYDFREKKFDVIWMGHVFQSFRDPKGALRKAYSLMPEDGVVVITTPDIDFLHQITPIRFPHWKHKEHYTLWNKVSLKREAEKSGFQVVMCRSNFSERYLSWWDIHIILQKIYL